MELNAAIDLINASDLNAAQKRAAVRAARHLDRHATSTLEGDKADLEVNVTSIGSFASVFVTADSKLYGGHLGCTLGPRGGISNVTADLHLNMGGKTYMPTFK